MALDWSREVSFTGLKRRSAASKSGYPEKTHMNLAADERRVINLRRTALMALLVVVAVALVMKFGIFDFYERVGAKQAELAAREQALSALSGTLAEYDDVLAEYESYESTNILQSGLAVDAGEALSLVDRCVTPYARVASLTLSLDTLSLKLVDTSLGQVGQLVAALEEQDIVYDVVLSTAETQQAEAGEVSATVTVTLQSPGTDAGVE